MPGRRSVLRALRKQRIEVAFIQARATREATKAYEGIQGDRIRQLDKMMQQQRDHVQLIAEQWGNTTYWISWSIFTGSCLVGWGAAATRR